MYRDKKIVVVLPAYNAARTLRQTYVEIREQQFVDEMILVDDGSRDDTVALARSLEGIQVHVHERNKGYGGNQKTCYRLALEAGADVVVMIHPDYQYTPKLLPAMVSIIRERPASLRARQPDSGRIRAQRGDAALEETCRIVPSRLPRTCCWDRSFRSITRAIGRSRARSWRRFPGRETRMISSLTTRCWRKFSGTVSPWRKSVVRRCIFGRRPRSTCPGASGMAWAAWGRRLPIGWPG